MAENAVLKCCGRVPQEGEFIHPDLTTDPAAEMLWTIIGWRVEAMAELISPDCPVSPRETIYFQRMATQCGSLDRCEKTVLQKKQMAAEVLLTGFERTGWPVCRQGSKYIWPVDGMHRMALQRARGVPVRAIMIGQRRDKPAHS